MNHRARIGRRTAGVAAAGLLTLTACGGGGLHAEQWTAARAEEQAGVGPEAVPATGAEEPAEAPELRPREYLAAATEELRAATALRVTGDLVVDGVPLGMDLWMDDTDACLASIDMAGEGAMEFIQLGDDYWLKGDEAYWAAADEPEVEEFLDGRYLAGSLRDAPGAHTPAEFCTMDEFLGEWRALGFVGEVAEVGRSELDGVPVVEFELTRLRGEVSELHIMAERPHHLVRVSGPADGVHQTMDFEFNVPVEVTAPTDEESVSMAELLGG
ncbi:hypothetical protein [Streptomyces bohaiensis]|uniref:Lipoprotein n=1 Tax=Streptomyces bohaiensis TaxID=1431344 RepID=A0ABX1CFI5_9ACTN|nr:hypothetical protein [Streptomyces bohaiensis]NJQ16938.1 hypothetical protein [Streptomyces bohaiensis]